jgi:2'-5' RNA ligase
VKSGIFIIAELTGPVGARVHEIQRRFDPRLAAEGPPHVTITGSSGAGTIPLDTTVAELRERLEPITDTTAPLTLTFGPPVRFMQTDIVALTLNPHGPLRTLHERIRTSGLRFKQARFFFSPHCTLSFYPRLTPEAARQLLAVRIPEPFVVDHIQVYRTLDPQPPQRALDLPLRG